MSDMSNVQNQGSNSDLRYFPRWEVKNEVSCRLEDDREIIKGATSDMSCAGACISISKDFQPEQKLDLTIRLSENVYVDLCGKINWVKSDESGKRIGISFYNTSERAQDLILQHAFDVDSKKMVNHWFKGWE